jgi:CRP/FNR family cyclic AMP-dependent transcriptional regulator
MQAQVGNWSGACGCPARSVGRGGTAGQDRESAIPVLGHGRRKRCSQHANAGQRAGSERYGQGGGKDEYSLRSGNHRELRQLQLRRDKWFCGLSSDVLKAFSACSHLSTYPGDAILFVEGQMPRGGFVLCSGKVKLSTTSRDVSAVISGTPYEVTAETAGPCQVNFIDRDALMKLLDKYGELGLHAAQALSREFQSAYRDIHELVLARSSAGKLAWLLLSWSGGRQGANEIRIRSSLTHEEIAQMIGSSRETVTRLLSELKKKELIRLKGSTLVIRNRTALEAMAA